jgi:hypothetical protein
MPFDGLNSLALEAGTNFVVDRLCGLRNRIEVAPTKDSPHRPQVGLDAAADYAYWRINTPEFINVLAVDDDGGNWRTTLTSLIALGCPTPNTIIINPMNNHAQFNWWLKTPVGLYRDPGRKGMKAKPVHWLECILRDLVDHIGADASFSIHGFIRNPLYTTGLDVRHLSTDLYGLADFDPIRIPRDKGSYKKTKSEVRDERVAKSRDWDMFYQLGDWCRTNIHLRDLGRTEWMGLVETKAEELYEPIVAAHPDKTDDFPLRQARKAARSVGRWYFDVYEERQRDRPMGLDESLPVEIRYRLGQENTAKTRRGNSIELIAAAREANPGASKDEVAQITGLSRATVYRRWNDAPSGSQRPTVELPVLKTDGVRPIPDARANETPRDETPAGRDATGDDRPVLPPEPEPTFRNGKETGASRSRRQNWNRERDYQRTYGISSDEGARLYEEKLRAEREASKARAPRRIDGETRNAILDHIQTATASVDMRDFNSGRKTRTLPAGASELGAALKEKFDAADDWLALFGIEMRPQKTIAEQREYSSHWSAYMPFAGEVI